MSREINSTLDPLKRKVFVAVLGLHSSGSSCLAGVLHHLGVHMGNILTGYYGDDPSSDCGFEAIGLGHICETYVPFLQTEYASSEKESWEHLKNWITEKQEEADEKKTIAGGKYPQLSLFGPQLIGICGCSLRVIVSERPIEHSVKSLHKRCGNVPFATIDKHQKWLEEGKRWILRQVDDSQKMTVNYYDLLDDPEKHAYLIADFLEISPARNQVQSVIEWVDPKKCHIEDL